MYVALQIAGIYDVATISTIFPSLYTVLLIAGIYGVITIFVKISSTLDFPACSRYLWGFVTRCSDCKPQIAC